jgi:hypothetical protein
MAAVALCVWWVLTHVGYSADALAGLLTRQLWHGRASGFDERPRSLSPDSATTHRSLEAYLLDAYPTYLKSAPALSSMQPMEQRLLVVTEGYL